MGNKSGKSTKQPASAPILSTSDKLKQQQLQKAKKKLDYGVRSAEQRWKNFVKAFFKTVDREGPGNTSLEWLSEAQLVFMEELEKGQASHPFQKEVEALQGQSRPI